MRRVILVLVWTILYFLMMNYLRLYNLIDYIETSKVIARVAQQDRCMPSV